MTLCSRGYFSDDQQQPKRSKRRPSTSALRSAEEPEIYRECDLCAANAFSVQAVAEAKGAPPDLFVGCSESLLDNFIRDMRARPVQARPSRPAAVRSVW